MADDLIKQTLTFSQEGLPVPPPKKNLAKIVIAIVIVVFLGTGVSLATQIWDPLWNPFRPSPETVIEKMTEKMGAVQTIHSNIDFETSIKNETAFDFKINTQADTDSTNPDNLKDERDFNLSFNVAGMQTSLGFKQKTIGQSSYIKLTTVPAQVLGPVLQGLGIDINQLRNTWIKIDEDSLKNFLGPEFSQKIEEEQEKSKEKQVMMVEKLKKLVENKKLYLVKEELSDAKVGEIKTYHYIVALNKEEIKSIVPELLKIFGEEEGAQSLAGENLQKLQGEIDNFFEKIGELSGEVWIGKRDKFLYRLSGDKNFDISQFAKGKKGAVIVKLNIDFSNFNQPIVIEPPPEFKSIEEIFKLPTSK